MRIRGQAERRCSAAGICTASELAKMTPAAAIRTCPCGSNQVYADCCGRWHTGSPAPDAEALMRSRYAAYVLVLKDYLRATWAPETCPATFEPDPQGLKWLGLDVKRYLLVDHYHATVEFVARSKLNGRAHRLHERSRFERREGRWVYVDGELLR
jgi:SEC-C motif-containing protein